MRPHPGSVNPFRRPREDVVDGGGGKTMGYTLYMCQWLSGGVCADFPRRHVCRGRLQCPTLITDRPATEVAFSISQHGFGNLWFARRDAMADAGCGLRKTDAEGGGMVRWATSDGDPGGSEDGRAAAPAPVPQVWTVSNSGQPLVPRVVWSSLYGYALYNHLFTIAPGANGVGRRVVDRTRGIRYTSMCFLLPDMPSCLAGCRSGGGTGHGAEGSVGPKYTRVGLGL